MKPGKTVLSLLSLLVLLPTALAWNGTASAAYRSVFENETLETIRYVLPDAAGDCSSWRAVCGLDTALLTAAAGDETQGNINADPLLESLANNGGYTQTHALLAGSPAFDAGDPETWPDTYQRGRARPVDGDGDGLPVCDIGAYELKLSYDLYLPVGSK